MKRPQRFILMLLLLFGSGFLLTNTSAQTDEALTEKELAKKILNNDTYDQVMKRAKKLLKGRFSAGTSYSSVWIRDLNTFIELGLEVNDSETVRKRLLTFFHFQGNDGSIPDGYAPKDQPHGGAGRDDVYRRSDTRPDLLGHKNTVETDQESSLVQSIHKYIEVTGDRSILDETIKGTTVRKRLDQAMQWVMDDRFSEEYGLVWGATTVDWGDVQPEHEWGVDIDENTHRAIDLYDNVMFLIAIESYLDIVKNGDRRSHWKQVHKRISQNTMKHLWDEKRQKFRPNVYLEGDPWPDWFDESRIYYTGSPAMAIRAGILSEQQIDQVYRNMVNTKRYAGAASVGIVNFPTYPSGFFKNDGLRPYHYQNGGDWTWWGGRIVQYLALSGRVNEAYHELQPMLDRVLENDGFYEWYTIDNKPNGSGEFRGSAGVLGKAIRMLRDWARAHRSDNR